MFKECLLCTSSRLHILPITRIKEGITLSSVHITNMAVDAIVRCSKLVIYTHFSDFRERYCYLHATNENTRRNHVSSGWHTASNITEMFYLFQGLRGRSKLENIRLAYPRPSEWYHFDLSTQAMITSPCGRRTSRYRQRKSFTAECCPIKGPVW